MCAQLSGRQVIPCLVPLEVEIGLQEGKGELAKGKGASQIPVGLKSGFGSGDENTECAPVASDSSASPLPFTCETFLTAEGLGRRGTQPCFKELPFPQARQDISLRSTNHRLLYKFSNHCQVFDISCLGLPTTLKAPHYLYTLF